MLAAEADVDKQSRAKLEQQCAELLGSAEVAEQAHVSSQCMRWCVLGGGMI